MSRYNIQKQDTEGTYVLKRLLELLGLTIGMFAFFLQANFLLFVRPHLFESLGSGSLDFLYVGPQFRQ